MRQREEKEKTVRWRDEKNRDMDFPYVWRKKATGVKSLKYGGLSNI